MSLVLVARKGRHQQRYENGYRLVAGCIPYRQKTDTESHSGNLIDRLEVLMVSSPNRDDFIFPKGGWENDESVEQAARREAWEEAGVDGIISETCLGSWIFRSKSRQNSCSHEGTCKGYIYALKVTEELQCWPEQASHKRRWIQVREAFKLCRYDWMRFALESFIRLMSDQTMLPAPELPEPKKFQLLHRNPSTAVPLASVPLASTS
ncbi:nudix hydrolase 12, mitochondrial-like [Phoenix dactylifera]|uniref:Nudix hydrolase 12, mitochondrial-like n=1 Tax=Phoenix dactylifera TaxID=42345 RepID=A0A8B7CE47_PHODC|nr:nudix hydrolase 12, mitochondrial-like [Phoenix dactylifera]XP_008797102.2 nudix hydrolase 12, mitochondrial-like [Phoenix dactylifera]